MDIAEQDQCVGRILREHNDVKKELECLRLSAKSLASQLSKVVEALADAATDLDRLPLEFREMHPEGYDLVVRISKQRGRMIDLAKSLRKLGVPSSLPDTE